MTVVHAGLEEVLIYGLYGGSVAIGKAEKFYSAYLQNRGHESRMPTFVLKGRILYLGVSFLHCCHCCGATPKIFRAFLLQSAPVELTAQIQNVAASITIHVVNC